MQVKMILLVTEVNSEKIGNSSLYLSSEEEREATQLSRTVKNQTKSADRRPFMLGWPWSHEGGGSDERKEEKRLTLPGVNKMGSDTRGGATLFNLTHATYTKKRKEEKLNYELKTESTYA